VAWANITGIPAAFADGVDNDTTYSAGAGLNLSGANQFNANFGGSGAATTVARSDHGHFGAVWGGNQSFGLGLSVTNGAANGAGLYGQQGSGSGFPYAFGNTAGVWGEATQGSGVYGASATYRGVQGVSLGAQGSGVYGTALSTTGTNYGVFGKTASTNGAGVYGLGVATTTNLDKSIVAKAGAAVFGESSTGIAVAGVSDRETGVFGTSCDGFGVYGSSAHSVGVDGYSIGSDGVDGFSWYRDGVYGGGSRNGVWGESDSGVGVKGSSFNGGVPLLAELDAASPTNSIIEAWQDTGPNRLRRFRVTGGGDVYAAGAFHPNGADFAEMLPAQAELEAGDVLVINEDGKLGRCTKPNQPNVAGVHATQPGLVGGAQEGADLTGKAPLAVVGVVPVKVTSENGPIKPGDKLTTSSTAGHAMKADKHPEVGTVIGKALTALEGKQGVIQMLVVLQ
jgi:hypothetical protein